jgi:hypothetical protein
MTEELTSGQQHARSGFGDGGLEYDRGLVDVQVAVTEVK